MKKLAAKLSLITSLLLTGTSSLQAEQITNYSIAVELARSEKVDSLVKKINDLYSYIQFYSYQTGDSTPTIGEINTYSSLDIGAWENFNGNSMSISFSDSEITFNNLFSTTPSEEVLNFLKNNPNLTSLSSIDEVSFKLKRIFEADFTNYIRKVKEIESNPAAVISETAPSDTTKTWYKPDGTGGLDMYGYNPAIPEWSYYGNTSSGNSDNNRIIVKSMNELEGIPATKGMTVIVSEDGIATEYIYDGTEWAKTSSGEANGLFNGDGTILDMATKLIGKAGGSIVTSSDGFESGVKHTFSGARDFIKKENSQTNGYWSDSSNNYIVSATLNDLSTQSWTDGTYAFLPKDDNQNIDLLKRINGNWVYVADGFMNVVQDMNEAKNNNAIVWDKTNNKYFRYANNYWYSTNTSGAKDNQIFLTSSTDGRSAFSAINSSSKYYVLNNDCISTNCNGDSSTDYYAGTKEQNMYVFYYSNSGKRKNNLIDATPRTSLADIYSHGDIASIYNNNIYFKKTDNKGRIIYLNGNDGYSYAGNGAKIPTLLAPQWGTISANLPPAISPSAANFSGNYLVLSNRTQATDWVDAPANALVTISGASNYIHKQSGSLIDFWTNNGSGDGVTSASEIFTKGSRSQFPVVNKSIIALTKTKTNAGYTTNGIASTIDNSFLQWYYASIGTRTNNLVDAVACSWSDCYSNTTAKNVGIAINSDGNILSWNGNHWKYSSYYVFKKYTAAKYASNTTIADHAIGYSSYANVYYDNNGRYSVYSSASSYCSSIGMRLPTSNETTAKNTNGVPSLSGATWTSTSCGYNWRCQWKGTQGGGFDAYIGYPHYYRCVK